MVTGNFEEVKNGKKVSSWNRKGTPKVYKTVETNNKVDKSIRNLSSRHQPKVKTRIGNSHSVAIYITSETANQTDRRYV